MPPFYFYDMTPIEIPEDASYFFNVLVVDIQIRASLQNNSPEVIDEYWNIEEITKCRPVAYHIYTVADTMLDKNENYSITLFPHSVIEVSDSFGICSFDMLKEDEYEEEYTGIDIQEIEDLDDWWRL